MSQRKNRPQVSQLKNRPLVSNIKKIGQWVQNLKSASDDQTLESAFTVQHGKLATEVQKSENGH